jgi:hypothetical protein
MGKNTDTFRKRLASGDLLIGTFIKTPSPIIACLLQPGCFCQFVTGRNTDLYVHRRRQFVVGSLNFNLL